MPEPPRPGPLDALAVASVLALLAIAYAVVPDPAVQYGVWLAIFAIWMLWFVSFGVRWLYDDSA